MPPLTRTEIKFDPLDEQNFEPCYEATDEECDEEIEIDSKNVDDGSDIAAHGAAIEEICTGQSPGTGDPTFILYFNLVRLFQ